MSLRTIIEKAGNFISAKRRINLIEGSNIILTVVENGEKVDVTIASTGGGGGGGSGSGGIMDLGFRMTGSEIVDLGLRI